MIRARSDKVAPALALSRAGPGQSHVVLPKLGAQKSKLPPITGHKSLSLVAHYTKAASQEQMAVDAMAKLAARRG